MEEYPEIIIQYGRLIDSVSIFYTQNHPSTKKYGWHDWTPPSQAELERRIDTYKKEWKKYDLVKDISRVLNLSFKRRVIDVFIVSGTSRATSHPIIIKSGLTPDRFVITLAHELIHRILSINEVPPLVYDESVSSLTNNHVIVYAVLKKILNEKLWNIVIGPQSKYPSKEYSLALELSEEIGVGQVIERMIETH